MQVASGVLSTYDDANDPDINSIATLFVDGGLESCGGGAGAFDLESHKKKDDRGTEAAPAHASVKN